MLRGCAQSVAPLLALAVLAGCSRPAALADPLVPPSPTNAPAVSYRDQVQPVFERRWGVRRTSASLWSTLDWLHQDYRRREPTEFGLFDLNRYKNL